MSWFRRVNQVPVLLVGILWLFEGHQASRLLKNSKVREQSPTPWQVEDADIPGIMTSAMSAAKLETSEASFFPVDMNDDLMLEITTSFAEPMVSLSKSSSRSGAKLFVSSDEKFFLKTIARIEYDALWNWVHHTKKEYEVDDYPSYAPGTNIYSAEHCTALVGLGRSRCKGSLLVPLYFAFRHIKKFKWFESDLEESEKTWDFILMPSAFVREKQSLQSMYPLNTDYLTHAVLDIKPLPSRSDIDDLAPLMKHLDLRLEKFTGIEEFRQMLADDTAGLNKREMIDYSMLVWSAQFEAKSEPKLELPGCIQSCKPGEEGVSCVMLCFSLIDYLVEFTLLRHLEDKYKYLHGRGDKFQQYGQKANDMMHCLGNLPVYGLQFMECMPYLQKACKYTGKDLDIEVADCSTMHCTKPLPNSSMPDRIISKQKADEVCKENAEQMDILATGIVGDLFDDVKGAAGSFAGAIGGAVKWALKWSTVGFWGPVLGVKKLGGKLVDGVSWLLDSRTREQIEEEQKLKFLQEQMEIKLHSENEKAAFQFWCQKRFWRSLREENCVKKDGIRWRHDYGRWEAIWRSGKDHFLYAFKVELPTKPADFTDDGTLQKGWNDFETTLSKAEMCLERKDPDACVADGGIAVADLGAIVEE